MDNCAVIIGVDDYAIAEWRLTASVDDALRFAVWAVGKGEVDPADLYLLLSPSRGRGMSSPVTLPGTKISVQYIAAESNEIVDTLDKVSHRNDKRLYLYFAGHGCSAPGTKEDWFPEPVLIPVDVQSLPKYSNRILGYSQVIDALADSGPQEQFFFLDACRDFSLEGYRKGAGSPVGPVRGKGARRNQYLLHASSPGQQAKAIRGVGVFGGALLQGLGGNYALQYNDGNDTFDVTFSKLAEYVNKNVSERIARNFPTGAAEYVQQPQGVPSPNKNDTVIISYSRSQVEKSNVTVLVSPKRVLPQSKIEVTFNSRAGEMRLAGACLPGPLRHPAYVQITPGTYFIKVEPPRKYLPRREKVTVPPDTTIDFEIEAAPASGGTTASGAPVQAAITILTFTCGDDKLPVLVLRPDLTPVMGLRTVTIADATPGTYRVRLMLPEGAGPEMLFEFPDDGAFCELIPPAPKMTEEQMNALAAAGMVSAGPYVTPSELIGDTGDSTLATLLAYAAYATYSHQDPGSMNKLRSFGLRPLPDLKPGNGWVTVLVAASGNAPVIYATLQGDDENRTVLDPKAFLQGSVVAVLTYDEEVHRRGVPEPLAGLPAAAELGCECPAGPQFIEVRLPGSWHTRYSALVMPNRVTTLIVVANDDGTFDVQHYMLPLGTEAAALSAHELRSLESAERYYMNLDQVPHGIAAALKGSEIAEPIAACLSAYVLIRHDVGKADADTLELQLRSDIDELIGKLLTKYPDLPDSYILAGLAKRDKADAARYFAEAAERGVPLFTEGMQALFRACKGDLHPFFGNIVHSLLPGSPWTAWTPHEPAIEVVHGKIGEIPHGWQGLEAQRANLESLLRSVGAVQKRTFSSGSLETIGTAWLVAPSTVVSSFRVVMEAANVVNGKVSVRGDCELSVSFAENPSDANSRIVVKDIKQLPELHMSVLTLERSVEVPVMPIADSQHTVRALDNICLIGYPTADSRNDAALAKGVIYRPGCKHVQPGIILEIAEDRLALDHSCFTMRGSGGSPVVHLETGKVVAVHWGGWKKSYGRGRAALIPSPVPW